MNGPVGGTGTDRGSISSGLAHDLAGQVDQVLCVGKGRRGRATHLMVFLQLKVGPELKRT